MKHGKELYKTDQAIENEENEKFEDIKVIVKDKKNTADKTSLTNNNADTNIDSKNIPCMDSGLNIIFEFEVQLIKPCDETYDNDQNMQTQIFKERVNEEGNTNRIFRTVGKVPVNVSHCQKNTVTEKLKRNEEKNEGLPKTKLNDVISNTEINNQLAQTEDDQNGNMHQQKLIVPRKLLVTNNNCDVKPILSYASNSEFSYTNPKQTKRVFKEARKTYHFYMYIKVRSEQFPKDKTKSNQCRVQHIKIKKNVLFPLLAFAILILSTVVIILLIRQKQQKTKLRSISLEFAYDSTQFSSLKCSVRSIAFIDENMFVFVTRLQKNSNNIAIKNKNNAVEVYVQTDREREPLLLQYIATYSLWFIS